MMYEGVVWRQMRAGRGYDLRVHAPLYLSETGKFVNLNTQKEELVISAHPMSTERRKLWLEEPK